MIDNVNELIAVANELLGTRADIRKHYKNYYTDDEFWYVCSANPSCKREGGKHDASCVWARLIKLCK